MLLASRVLVRQGITIIIYRVIMLKVIILGFGILVIVIKTTRLIVQQNAMLCLIALRLIYITVMAVAPIKVMVL